MIVVVDVIMLWPVVTRESGRGQRELRELSSRADWYDYHHHFPELRIQSPKSPKDNHLYLGRKINVVCTLINFVLVYVGCLWHVGFHLMLKGESPRNIAWSNIWPSLWSSLIDTSWIESLKTSRTLTSLSMYVTIKVNKEWRRQIHALKKLVIWDIQRAIHFMNTNPTHSCTEMELTIPREESKCTRFLRGWPHHSDKWSTRTSCEHSFYFSVCTICGQ